MSTTIICTVVWLLGLVVINRAVDNPIQFIVPYALPVVVFTWKYGLRPGLIVAAGSVLAAALGGALPSNAYVSLVEDGLYAYAKLSAVAMGVSLALYTRRRHLRSGSE